MWRQRLRRAMNYVVFQRQLFHGRLLIVNVMVHCIPEFQWGVVRGLLYRWGGFRHIDYNVHIFGALNLHGQTDIYARLRIGEGTTISEGVDIDLGGRISIGKRVAIGPRALFITTEHQLGPQEERCGTLGFRQVTIGDGAWIGARAIVTPGVTIGPGAVVAAGAVVTRDVPANAEVAGNPARVVRWLDGAPKKAWGATDQPLEGFEHRVVPGLDHGMPHYRDGSRHAGTAVSGSRGRATA